MTMLVSICRVSHIPVCNEMAEFHAEHREVFGDAVGKMTFLRDPQGANHAAVVSKVRDLEKMRQISRTVMR